MKKPRSFVRFKDGHMEDIIYFDENGEGSVLFATESGIYSYHKNFIPTGVSGLKPICFQKITLDRFNNSLEFCDDMTIQCITIDKRVPYEYEISVTGSYIYGEALAEADADDETIRKLIMDDLDIAIKKKE